MTRGSIVVACVGIVAMGAIAACRFGTAPYDGVSDAAPYLGVGTITQTIGSGGGTVTNDIFSITFSAGAFGGDGTSQISVTQTGDQGGLPSFSVSTSTPFASGVQAFVQFVIPASIASTSNGLSVGTQASDITLPFIGTQKNAGTIVAIYGVTSDLGAHTGPFATFTSSGSSGQPQGCACHACEITGCGDAGTTMTTGGSCQCTGPLSGSDVMAGVAMCSGPHFVCHIPFAPLSCTGGNTTNLMCSGSCCVLKDPDAGSYYSYCNGDESPCGQGVAQLCNGPSDCPDNAACMSISAANNSACMGLSTCGGMIPEPCQ